MQKKYFGLIFHMYEQSLTIVQESVHRRLKLTKTFTVSVLMSSPSSQTLNWEWRSMTSSESTVTSPRPPLFLSWLCWEFSTTIKHKAETLSPIRTKLTSIIYIFKMPWSYSMRIFKCKLQSCFIYQFGKSIIIIPKSTNISCFYIVTRLNSHLCFMKTNNIIDSGNYSA